MLNKKVVLSSVSVAFLAFVVVHFVLLNIYVSPESWKNERFSNLAESYVSPQFYQAWGVFAPVPREEYKLFYKYFSNGEWSSEVSFEDEMNKKNHPFAHRISDFNAYFLCDETRKYTLGEEGDRDYSVVKSSYYYDRVVFTVFTHITTMQTDQKVDSIELILERNLLPKFGYSQKKKIRDYYGADACE